MGNENINKVDLLTYLETNKDLKQTNFVSKGMVTTPTKNNPELVLDCLDDILKNEGANWAFETEIHHSKPLLGGPSYYATAEAYRFNH